MTTPFFQSETDALKVSVSTVILSKMELNKMMSQVAEISTNLAISQSIRLNYPHQFKSKMITHSGPAASTVCYTEKVSKRKIAISNNKEYTTQIIQTTSETCNSESVQSISLTHALSYALFQYPEWSLNILVTKMITNPQEFTTRLQEYKTNLLKDYKDFASELDETTYDMIAIELQFNGTTINKPELIDVLKYIDNLLVANHKQDYQQMIYSVAKEIYRDQMTAGRFKERSGFKQLIPSAIELSRTIYFKDVLPIIDQFYITDKIDGSRTLLQITEYFKRNGRKKTLLGADIMSLSNDINVIQTFDKKPNNLRGIDVVKTILDTEMIMEANKPSFQAFDVIMIQSKKMSNLPFKMRIKEFGMVNDMLQHYKLGRTKTFIKLTKDKYQQQLESFYEKALASEYEIDGIIFTPEGLHYKEAAKQKIRTNTEYYNTISFKWKPLEQSTIDFYMMAVDPTQAKVLRKAAGQPFASSEQLYALCSGVDIITFKKLNLEFFDGYVAPESENSAQYFPIQFAPYDNPWMYLWSSKETDLGGRVAEFKFVDASGTMLKKPEIVRMRDDRSNDVRKGEYFGNALRYSELIWHSIKHPLTFEMLGLAPSDIGGYFAANSENDYFAQRAFNSFVKAELIKTYLKPATKGNTGSIIDLGAGKGQELARLIDLGFDNITMADRDIDALYELLQRKYNLRLKTKDASASVHIRQIDFENAYEDTIASVELPKQLDASMMNFAIHYLCHDKTEHNKNLPISDLFKLVDHTLKSKGRFLITCFDGQMIFNILQERTEWSSESKKYSIKKAYTSDVLTDLNQAIDVLLPFSGGSYYREYLVNMKFLETVANDHGFQLIANESFSTMLQQFKKNNSKVYSQLDDNDKEYVSLYSYAVFEKQ